MAVSNGSSTDLRARIEAWRRNALEPALERAPERKPEFRTEALRWPVKRVYPPLDLEEAGFDYLRDLGLPGEAPYTRSTAATGYGQNLWTPLQVTGFGTGSEVFGEYRPEA